MIWYYLLSFFGNLLNAAFSFLPEVTTLPLGMDLALTTMVGSFKAIYEIMPWFGVIFTAFMWYAGFRISLLVLRLMRIVR